MSRRPQGWVLLLAVAVALPACIRGVAGEVDTTTTAGPSSTTTAATPATTTRPAPTTTLPARTVGGEVHVGVIRGEPATLNPFLQEGGEFTVGLVGQTMWAGVQDIDPDTLGVVPDLVAEFPTAENGGVEVNEDGTMTVRYDIPDEAVWEDGSPITGSDFEFTYRTVMNRRLPIRGTIFEVYRDIIPGSLVVEEKSFELRLRRPTLEYELLFEVIIPESQVSGTNFARDWNDRPWMSGGPFRFVEWDGGELRVERNEAYWKVDPETGQQLPYLDALVFHFFEDSVEMVDAFKRREIDVINPPLQHDLLEELQALEQEGAMLDVRSGPGWEHLNFQFGPGRTARNEDSLVEHKAFRQAVAHLLDRPAVASRVFDGLPGPLDSFLPVYWPQASHDAFARYTPDLQQARRLLSTVAEDEGRDFGTDPPRLVFTTTDEPERIEVAAQVVRSLSEGGIEVEVQLEEPGRFFEDTVKDGQWEMGEWAWIAKPGRFGLVQSLQEMFLQLPPNGFNFYRWRPTGSNVEGAARAAELLEDLHEVVDERELLSRLAELERIIADEVVIIPLYAEPNPGVVWEDEVGGYRHNATRAADTWNAAYWHRVDE